MKKHVFATFLMLLGVSQTLAQQSAQVLAGILEEKGILTSVERTRIMAAAPDEAVQMIVAILRDKGLLNGAEVARVGGEAHTTTAAKAVTPEATKGPVLSTPPVMAESKLPITVYGTILMNAFSNTSLNNNEDVPLFAGKQGTDPTGGDKNFGMTARQSRFGMRYDGLTIGDAKVSGVFEFDLFGGAGSLPIGVGFDLLRARLAYGRMDWKNYSFVAGQDWTVFAPLNPTSLAAFGTPDLTASGNLFLRTPQLRFEMRHELSDRSRVQLQIAAIDPNNGDNPLDGFSDTHGGHWRARAATGYGRAAGLERRRAGDWTKRALLAGEECGDDRRGECAARGGFVGRGAGLHDSGDEVFQLYGRSI